MSYSQYRYLQLNSMNAPKGYIPRIKIPDNFFHLTVEEKRSFAKQMREMLKNIHTLILESLEPK